MTDDGIALFLVEAIKDSLEERGFQVFFAETDVNYCLSHINEGDFIFFIDSTYWGMPPGNITIIPINQVNHLRKPYTQHDFNVFNLLQFYNIYITGFLIGIEVVQIKLGLGLSPLLQQQFTYLVNQVKRYLT